MIRLILPLFNWQIVNVMNTSKDQKKYQYVNRRKRQKQLLYPYTFNHHQPQRQKTAEMFKRKMGLHTPNLRWGGYPFCRRGTIYQNTWHSYRILSTPFLSAKQHSDWCECPRGCFDCPVYLSCFSMQWSRANLVWSNTRCCLFFSKA